MNGKQLGGNKETKIKNEMKIIMEKIKKKSLNKKDFIKKIKDYGIDIKYLKKIKLLN